ncbi:MAG: hypothetical protein LBD07_00490 [Spirochaetaceae bacterium]|nr:hypothetical protein [Spirochaetaceae bacterium]
MVKIKTCISVLFLFLITHFLPAAEYEDGRIKLVIDENNGRFSLYYMTDVDKKTFEPLFWDRDKKTSFLAVCVNGSEYKLGESSRFKTYVRGTDTKPALVFESPFLAVTEQFSFIRTSSSGVSNGVRVDIKIENWGEKTAETGVRLLIDTFLGETNTPSFRTDLRPVESELIIDQSSRDQWWLSRNEKYGIMGSVFVEGIDPPSYIHFANWKRLYNAAFKTEYVYTRNFSDLPFSIRDSAVCYYLDIRPLERWQSCGFTALFAADDKYGFDIKRTNNAFIARPSDFTDKTIPADILPDMPPNKSEMPQPYRSAQPQLETQPEAKVSARQIPASGNKDSILLPIGAIRVDLMTLREIIYKVDEYIYFGTAISEEELRGMEMAITRLKSRYGGIINPYR